jgi:hypothetical protein
MCQQYQLVEDCSFGSFVILRFCLSTLVGFLSTGEHLGRPMWGSGFGRSRDIKAQDVEKQETKTRLLPFTALGRFCCEEVWGECFVEALNAIKENTGLPLLPSWNDKSGIWAISR